VGDAVFDREVSAQSTIHREILPTFVNPSDPYRISFESLTPTIATVDALGYVTTSGPGLARIAVSTPRFRKVVEFDTGWQAEQTVDTWSGWAAGSLGAAMEAPFAARVTEGKEKAIFSTQNHTAGVYVRNPQCWAYGLDLTAISPWNSAGSFTRAGVAITRRHVLLAAHYPIPEGATIRFVTSAGAVVARTIVQARAHPDYEPYYPDLYVGVLDSDLPSTITPVKVFPSNARDYLPSLGGSTLRGYAAFGTDKEEKALVKEWYFDDTSGGREMVRFRGGWYDGFDETIIGGDSGNPSFAIVGSDLVLLTVWTFGGAGSGTSVRHHASDINALIAAVDADAGISTGYTLTEVDLSPYTNFA
jgi:hypothetical protein